MNVAEWVKSPEGQKKLVQILERSKSTAARLAEKRKVDPDSLKRPICENLESHILSFARGQDALLASEQNQR